jgi:hypothetical protein
LSMFVIFAWDVLVGDATFLSCLHSFWVKFEYEIEVIQRDCNYISTISDDYSLQLFYWTKNYFFWSVFNSVKT